MTLLISYMLQVKHVLNTPLNTLTCFYHKLCAKGDILMSFFPPPRTPMFVDLRNIQLVEVSNCCTTANHHNYTVLLLGPPLQPKAKQQESWNKPSLVFLMCPFSGPSKDLLCCQKIVLCLHDGVAFYLKAFTCNRTAGLPRGACAASCSKTNNWLHQLPFLLSHEYCMYYVP